MAVDFETKKMVDDACMATGVKFSEASRRLGLSRQALSNKLYRDTMDMRDLRLLAKAIGFDIVFVRKDNGMVIRGRSDREPVRKMINRVVYDSSRAILVVSSANENNEYTDGVLTEMMADGEGRLFFVLRYEDGSDPDIVLRDKEFCDAFLKTYSKIHYW